MSQNTYTRNDLSRGFSFPFPKNCYMVTSQMMEISTEALFEAYTVAFAPKNLSRKRCKPSGGGTRDVVSCNSRDVGHRCFSIIFELHLVSYRDGEGFFVQRNMGHYDAGCPRATKKGFSGSSYNQYFFPFVSESSSKAHYPGLNGENTFSSSEGRMLSQIKFYEPPSLFLFLLAFQQGLEESKALTH